ncbi:carboxylating.nicotinate-nucleotide diphosphorylase [Methanofollis aquaemaris]|uniref:Nicotinate-nucleotide pyrophosphorylase [carboxylating] n=1 Tax=Methanofollis aquaemaris TaxID=126734 RepID=A0A8A3S733_9EURY|nr:carboxylating nicotinate-nucleotide diphosphorylase [Methanofollis aquaemaris]QSZ68087.1 carboxylating.nicotinate-nucleotide diphosphorylase [Methanofollis aquaemaris]
MKNTTVDLGRLISFLEEDAPFGDITSEAVVPADAVLTAGVRTRERCVVAGLEEGVALFRHLGVEAEAKVEDGAEVDPGTTVMTVSGPARAVLLGERTVLNLIGRMSGIATATREVVRAVEAVDPHLRVASTRKTAPGLRALDKKAAVLGGGEGHRRSLSDMFLIKDNHLGLVGFEEAVRRARAYSVYHKVEIEVETVEDAVVAARAGADLILLDNMTPAAVSAAVEALKAAGLRDRVLIEVSGGITPETAPKYGGTGADLVSMGALTHTVRNVDVGLDIV